MAFNTNTTVDVSPAIGAWQKTFNLGTSGDNSYLPAADENEDSNNSNSGPGLEGVGETFDNNANNTNFTEDLSTSEDIDPDLSNVNANNGSFDPGADGNNDIPTGATEARTTQVPENPDYPDDNEQPPQNSPSEPEEPETTSTTLGETTTIVDQLGKTLETYLEEVAPTIYDTIPNSSDTYDSTSDNPSNTTYYRLKEKLNAEGFSEEFPQVIGMTEFKPLFSFIEANDPRSKSTSDLSKIIESLDLKETPINKLLEIQTHVKRICGKNTRQLFNIFNKSFTNNRYKNSPYINIQTFINDLNNLDQETKFMRDISYNFLDDTFSIEEIVQSLKNNGKSKGTNIAEFIKGNSNNPYVLAVLRYYILINFAKSIMSLLQKKLEGRGSFLNSFYDDVVVNSDIVDSDLKRVFNDLGLSINDFNNFLTNIFVQDLPTSANIARLVKAIHAIGSGMITSKEYKIYNNDNLDEANGLVVESIKSFLDHSRKMKYESFLKHAYNNNSYTTNSSLEESQSDPTSAISILSPYLFDKDLDITSYTQITRALIPLVYDIKNTISFGKNTNDINNDKDSQINLIENHLHPDGISSSEIYNNDKTYTNINTSKDVMKYFDKSIDINFSTDPNISKSIINTTDFSKLVYQNHDDKTILIADNNGIIHKDETSAIGDDNIQSLREFAFSLDDFSGDKINDVYSHVQTSVTNMTKQFKDNYAVKNLSEYSHIPEDYFTNFFDNLAEMIQDLRFLNTTSDTRLMETIALTYAGVSKKINKKTFIASLVLHHNIKLGDKIQFFNMYADGVLDSMVVADELVDTFINNDSFVSKSNANDFREAALIKVHNGQAFNGGEINTSTEASTDYYDYVKRSVFDYLFTTYYDKLIPGTQCTVGGGNQDDDAGEQSNLNQVLLDAVYKDLKKDKKRTYDGDEGNLEYIWDKSSEDKIQKIGTPKTIDLSVPSKSDTVYNMGGSWTATKINQPFKRMFSISDATNNQLLRHSFSYDEEFIDKFSELSNFLNIDDFLNKTSDIAYGSTSLARAYLLHFLTVRLFATSLSFCFKTTGLGEEKDKEKNHKKRVISIHYNIDQFKAMYDALKGLDPDSAKYNDESKPVYKLVFDNVKKIRDFALGHVEFHDKGMVIALSAFNKIEGYFKKVRDQNRVSQSDDSQTLTASSYLNSLTDDLQNHKFFDYYNIDQFKLNAVSLLKIMYPSKNNFYLPGGKDITDNQIACMRKFFSYNQEYSPGQIPRNKFTSSTQEELNLTAKKYMLHVGITNNMLSTIREDQIANIQDTSGITLTEVEKGELRKSLNRNSIIKINLFRKNMMSGEEVSVKSFFFDTSKFIIENIDHPKVRDIHSNLAKSNVKLRDFIKSHRFYHVDNTMNIHRMTAGQIFNMTSEASNENMTNTEKNDLIMNHLNDYYLKMYCKAILGIDYDEDIYHFNNALEKTLSRGYDTGFNEKNYITAFEQPIKRLIKTNDLSYAQERNRIESEAQRSIFFAPRKYLNRTILPKTFDRVFSLYLNMNELSTPGDNQFVFLDQFYCTIQLTTKVLIPGEVSSPIDLSTPAMQSVLNNSSTITQTIAGMNLFK